MPFGGANSSGNISVANGSTTVTAGSTYNWADVVARDLFFAGDSIGLIESVDAGAGTLELYTPWGGTTQVSAAYTILLNSPDRYDPTLNATRLQDLLDQLEAATTFDLISDHGSDVASASTVDLQAVGVANILDITGTTTITAITLAAGDFRFVRFAGALTLTNGSNLILPGGENIVTEAGDSAIFVGYAAGVVRCMMYQRVKGRLTPAVNMPSKTASYTILDSDHDAELVVGNNGMKTFTVQAASNYRTGFRCRVINSDSWGSGRGNRVTSTPAEFDDQWLYPNQTVRIFKATSGRMMLDPPFQRAKLPTGTKRFYLHYGTGSDTLSDGLDSGASAWNSVQSGVYNGLNRFDLTSFPQSIVEIYMLANESGTGAHLSGHALVGAQGGGALVLNGNGAVLSSSGGLLDLYHGMILEVKNITFNGTISANRDAYLYLLEGINFAGPGATGFDMIVGNGGTIEINSDYTISGANNRAYHISNQNGGYIDATTPLTATISANQNLNGGAGAWAVCDGPTETNLSNITWANYASVTGPKQQVSSNHVLRRLTNFPGSTDPAATTGGQIIVY